MSLLPLFDVSLIARAARPALECEAADGRRSAFTFGDLETRSNRLAQLLRARGLRAGDRVAFFLQNRVEVIDLWLAGAKLGLIVVPINVLYRERELKHVLTDAEPRAVVTSRELAGFVPAGVPIWDVDELAAAADGERVERVVEQTHDDTPLSLIYTSGTTGASKGAVLTHRNFACNGQELVRAWKFTAADRYLATLPLFHVHGLANGVHCWLLSGCHMRLTERFEHAKAAEWFEEYRPTVFFGVPAMYVRLLELPADTARAIGGRLRLAVSGSAPLPAEIHEKFRARFGPVILERYGMTETLMNVSNPYHGERRAGTVGMPLPLTAVRIVNDDLQDVPDGTSGELLVRGPNVCRGYWNRPLNADAFDSDGWFRTGDVGHLDADGHVVLTGRLKDVIIRKGENISAKEIEDLLYQHPKVGDVAVIGLPDKERGERVCAVVERAPDAEDLEFAEMVAYLKSADLMMQKIPEQLEVVDELPRNQTLRKVLKQDLRDTYREKPWSPAPRV